MLNFQDVQLRRGTRVLFEHATFTIYRGEKVGITGANGSGKSSLLALVSGELHPESGEFSRPAGLRIAAVAQETPAVEQAAIDYVLDGDLELRAVERLLASTAQTHDGAELAELHARFEALDGYAARSRAAQLLAGVGFASDELERPVSSFSGGWRMRLNLARALMRRSDLLLLDEPTNHLDLDAVIWLESWLADYRGTLLLIAHDREFLDGVVSRIVHLERQALRAYSGNYSAFETQRAADLALAQALYEKQQREIRHVLQFVERFRAKQSKARQAQSRLKLLERMERIAPAHVDTPFEFEFLPPEKLPRPLLRIEGQSVSFGERRVLEDVDLTLMPGDRIAVLGRNGAGKSTLMKLLAGVLDGSGGRREQAADLRVGYFAQHQLEQLDDAASPFEHLRNRGGPGMQAAPEQVLRDHLGGFGFPGERAFEPVGPFSGGERARLVLALLVAQRPNLLLLDEPTNHLDLEMRHALSMALQEYSGALIVVAHDRHLIRSVADTLWLVADGGVAPFDGDLDDYARLLSQPPAGPSETGSLSGSVA
ncbi:MAG TPA: ATP-binding cassette domain-containing protein, partial [Steroidobacteraceae bacterium]|nr:ATP-binding cassette domain-containing protein [Steroidobacteraceae bacterium]